MGFDNSIIEPKRNNKPHIVFMNGLWRVSAARKCDLFFTTKVSRMFAKAHDFVTRLNEPILASREWGYKNVK